MHIHLHHVDFAPSVTDAVSMIQHAGQALGHTVSVSSTPGPGLNLVLCSLLLALRGERAPPDSILYTFEQHGPGSPWSTPEQIAHFRGHRLWSYDPIATERLVAHGLVADTVRPRHSPVWNTGQTPSADYDVAFFGSLVGERAAWLERIAQGGLTVLPNHRAFGAEQDALAARAKVVLSLASYPAPLFQALRIGRQLANRRYVVTDPFLGPERYPEAAHVHQVAPAHLLDHLRHVCRYDEERAAVAQRAADTYARFPYVTELESALARLSALPSNPLPSAPPQIFPCDMRRAAASALAFTVFVPSSRLALEQLAFEHDHPLWQRSGPTACPEGFLYHYRKFG